jgi:uncharacterized protein YlxP (DUF503 family)
MGFVSFPANDSEPAKSGPGVAQHLAHVYKEYLYAFDNIYIQAVIESKRKMQATGSSSGSNTNNQVPVNASTMASGPQNAPRPIPNMGQMQTVIQYAHVSAQELQNRGVAERIIQFVEAHREQLQRNAKMQQAWRGDISLAARPILNAHQMQTMIQYSHVSAQELRNRGVTEKTIQFIEAYREQLQHNAKMQQTSRSNISLAARPTIDGCQIMRTVIQYAHVSAQELRDKGVPDRIIQFVEAHREQLQRNAEMQQAWRGNVVKPSLAGQAGPPQDQDRMVEMATQAPFSSEQNITLPPALQHHPIPRPGQFMAPQQPGASSMPDDGNNMDAQFPWQPQGLLMDGVALDPPHTSQEQINHAQNFITKGKQDFMTWSKRTFKQLESDF